ncbi:hypothetical protein D3C81_2045050 [compost metagenome]
MRKLLKLCRVPIRPSVITAKGKASSASCPSRIISRVSPDIITRVRSWQMTRAASPTKAPVIRKAPKISRCFSLKFLPR